MVHSSLIVLDFSYRSDGRAEINSERSPVLALPLAEGNERLIQDMIIADWLYSGVMKNTNRGPVHEESLASVHMCADCQAPFLRTQ